MDFTFGGKYRLEEEIANGGCGTVFLGVHTVAGKEVAIKLEPAVSNKGATNSPLRQESKIYKTLMGGTGVPWIMWSGRQGDYNVMVIDLLGPSLEDLFKMCNRHFSLKTVLLLADQLPANFVMGTGKGSHMVNVIDFGLAKKFRDSKTSSHIPYKQDDYHGVGTSLFAAINTHLGVESSRRDDLESLAYMLIYFLRGTLPWKKLRAPNTPPPPASPTTSTPNPPSPIPPHQYNPVSATWDLIRDAKIEAEPLLTVGLPEEFEILYKYARGLEFDDLPDYDGLRNLFHGLAEKIGMEYDNVFDWTLPKASGARIHGRRSASDSHATTGRRFCEACHRRKTGVTGRQEWR
ncbi:hypothetical protein H0H92_007990 [Tricholoma furcatifolium]|nr:hypothetical protein H0H92_007990 [Tricholoma furcatifolium]